MNLVVGALAARHMGLVAAPSFGFATKNLKLIKNRMRAVMSIKKITKAMKMVAASKMKQDVNRLEKAKFFGVNTFAKVFESDLYLQKKKITPNVKRTLLVPITTDKGLCGGTNSSIVREIKAMVKEDRNAYRIVILGDKGGAALLRPFPELVDCSLTGFLVPLNFTTASAVSYQLVGRMDGLQCDRILLVYNRFKNVISQIQTKTEILSKKNFKQLFKYVVKYDISEPDPEFSLHHFYDFYASTTLFNAMLNNMASETSARMNAMENASKNAGQIVDKLNLEYNKARQAKITMELCEIISGAAAV